MAATRQQFLNLMVAGLRKVFFGQYKDYPSQYAEIYDVQGSKKRREDFDSVIPIGMLAAKPEGEALTYADPAMGYSKQFTHSTFAKGIRLTQELIEDELYGIMNKRAQLLSRAAAYRKEFDHATLFNNATATTYYTGQDGLALLSASHTLAGVPGTTFSNTTASTDLSQASLETAINAIRRFKDDNNLLINLSAATLLIPPELGWDADEILHSSQRPWSADNEVNSMRAKLKIVEWPFITDTNAWFVLVNKAEIAPISFNRVPVEFDKDGDFDTKDIKMSARMRYSLGFIDPRFCYGSMGSS